MVDGSLTGFSFWLAAVRAGARGCIATLIFVLAGCAMMSGAPADRPEIAPLQLSDALLTLDDLAFLAPTPDLLALDSEMEAFVERYTVGLHSDRQKLMHLHRAIKGAGVLNIQYDPMAGGAAMEAFHRGSVNCLSYSHLLIAMAREAGLDADYQRVTVRPQWTRMGERVAVRIHVNVRIKLRGHEEYMADISPLERRSVVNTFKISDRDAEALYHSNVAMAALTDENLPSAWAHAAKSVQLSPDMAHLWVNLGVVYRLAGQYDDAERSYLTALDLDSWDRSAMNNLVVLYEAQGREEQRLHWLREIRGYQRSNPYYHASMGDLAAAQGDWAQALEHYQKAVSLQPQDSQLLYATGLIHQEVEEYEEATRMISLAIEHATLHRDVLEYQARLDALKREPLAGLW